jgi:hypothetical protein
MKNTQNSRVFIPWYTTSFISPHMQEHMVEGVAKQFWLHLQIAQLKFYYFDTQKKENFIFRLA